MPFTDDDFRRLKDSGFIERPEMDALLARLEAAENCCLNLALQKGDAMSKSLLVIWRTKAGK